jgi:hypothetical protein
MPKPVPASKPARLRLFARRADQPRNGSRYVLGGGW